MDEKGNVINPTEPNAYKFEAFIFDAFSSIPEMLVMRVKREEEFAPVKMQRVLIAQKQQENYIWIILQNIKKGRYYINGRIYAKI